MLKWTEEKILTELKSIANELGYFPNQDYLKLPGRSGLLNAVNKGGGLPHYRNVLGYELKPRIVKDKKWTEERILTELKTVIEELGDFPTRSYLKSTGRGPLHTALCRNGGLMYFRDLLNYNNKLHVVNGKVVNRVHNSPPKI